VDRVGSFGVLRAEKHVISPVVRFPDSRRESAARAFPSVEAQWRGPRPVRSVTAYSGGTVWASHPLRVTAGVTSLVVSGFSRTDLNGSVRFSRTDTKW